MATATGKRAKGRGFAVLCPHCGSEDAISVRAEDVSLFCRECGEDVTPAQVRHQVGEWTRLLAWVESAPEVA
jgi:uncharacterized protein (DUF983 family)